VFWCLGFKELGSRVCGLQFRVKALGFKVWGSGLRV
jgi:hypothetical protein